MHSKQARSDPSHRCETKFIIDFDFIVTLPSSKGETEPTTCGAEETICSCGTVSLSKAIWRVFLTWSMWDRICGKNNVTLCSKSERVPRSVSHHLFSKITSSHVQEWTFSWWNCWRGWCIGFLLIEITTQEMSLNIDMKMIRLSNCSGGSLISNMSSWTLSQICNEMNWETFQSNSIDSPWTVSKVLCCDEFLSVTQHEFENVRETDDFFITDRRCQFPWRIIPNCIHSTDFNWFFGCPISQICRTSVSLWDNFQYFWWKVNYRSNAFPWNTDASNVEHSNIAHISECLLFHSE